MLLFTFPRSFIKFAKFAMENSQLLFPADYVLKFAAGGGSLLLLLVVLPACFGRELGIRRSYIHFLMQIFKVNICFLIDSLTLQVFFSLCIKLILLACKEFSMCQYILYVKFILHKKMTMQNFFATLTLKCNKFLIVKQILGNGVHARL